MKTTIDIADSLFARAKARARKQRITFRALVEKSLAETLDQPVEVRQIKPVTYKGKGLRPEFANASWDKIRDSIY